MPPRLEEDICQRPRLQEPGHPYTLSWCRAAYHGEACTLRIQEASIHTSRVMNPSFPSRLPDFEILS